MAYPGEGYSMANYGVKEPSPDERAGHWKECIRAQWRIHNEHLAIKGNGTDVWPGVKTMTKEDIANTESYYRKTKEHEQVCSYDRMFHQEEGYNSKLHRDDRQHTVGLDLHAEENKRKVPVLASTEYGRHAEQPLEERTVCYNRVEHIMQGFYRPRGTGIPSSME